MTAGAATVVTPAQRRDPRRGRPRPLGPALRATSPAGAPRWSATVDAAHDIASEAFIQAALPLGDRPRPTGYLYVTATNLVRDRWRREQRDRKLYERLEDTQPTSSPARATRGCATWSSGCPNGCVCRCCCTTTRT